MMFATWKKFSALAPGVRTMIFIFWTYKLAMTLMGIFLSVFVYLKTESLVALALFLLIGNTALMIGFVGGGLVMSHYGLSTQRNFLWAFLLFLCASIILVLLPHTYPSLLIFGALMSLGNGVFWLTIHTLELSQTKNTGRDFYSSMVELGGQVTIVLSPLLATLSFLLSEQWLHVETYTLLFFILPILYLCALPLVRKAPSFVPPKTTLAEVFSFFRHKGNTARIYYAAGASLYALHGIIIPIVAIFALKTVVNLGLVEIVLGIFSLLIITLLANYRHEGNRVTLMGISTCGFLVAFFLLLFYDSHVFAYLAYSFMAVALRPIQRVSEHMIDLQTVDSLHGGTSFFPALLYRDLFLWIFRALVGTFMIVLSLLAVSETTQLHVGIILMMGLIFTSWQMARRLMRKSLAV